MLESVRKLWSMASSGCKLILGILTLAGLSALCLLSLKKRGVTADSRRTSSQAESQAVVKIEEFKAGHARLETTEHLAEAARQEQAIPAIDAKLSAVRARIAALKKELGQ